MPSRFLTNISILSFLKETSFLNIGENFYPKIFKNKSMLKEGGFDGLCEALPKFLFKAEGIVLKP
jgi:hypothetical protein